MLNSLNYVYKLFNQNSIKYFVSNQSGLKFLNITKQNHILNCRYLTSNINENTYGRSSQNKTIFGKYSKYFLTLFGLLGFGYYKLNSSVLHCQEKNAQKVKDSIEEAGKFIEGLPVYTDEQVKQHNKNADRIWVTFKNGVYDITEFVDGHPGGNKILLAAGSSIEPFWEIYAVHKKPEVYEMLEEFRIGNLKIDPNIKKQKNDNKDPYANDPKRHPLLKVLTQKPFNAETPKEFSVENILTPNDLHFIRNHMPVPKIDPDNFKLEIINDLNGKKFEFNLDDIVKKFSVFTIPVTIQCTGNRRKSMNNYQSVQGLMWEENAISTAEWTGIKLKDLFVHCGIDLNDKRLKHVHFEGLDRDISGGTYAVSIPFEKAIDDKGDVMIAFKMNGEDIPTDHGYPLRAITPGIVGARSVKWLGKIVLSDKECQSHCQLNDYKVLSPSIKNLKDADFSNYKAVQESPVQSAICEPVEGTIINKENGSFKVKGYAFSGGGNDIESVLVSIDNGKTWKNAILNKFKRPVYKAWAWTLWEVDLEIPEDEKQVEILCVATDSNMNTQPETCKSIWNVRGLFNNSWHRVNVKFE